MKYDIKSFKTIAVRIFLELFSCLIVFLGVAFKNSDSYLAYAEDAVNHGADPDKDPPVFTGDMELIYEGELRGFARSVTVRVKAEDRGSGFDGSPFSFDGGKTWQKSGEYRVTENCRLSIQVKDRSGNKSAVKTLEIVNIDNQPPETGEIKAGVDADKWDVILEGCSDNVSDSKSLLYSCIRSEDSSKFEKDGRWNTQSLCSGGNWQKDPHFRIDPGKYHIFVLDEFGNIAEKGLEVGPIDNEPPEFADAPEFINESGANGYAKAVTVKVSAKDSGGGECLYSFDDGASWQKENSFRVTENCTLMIRSMDSFKNVSERLAAEITNIDREPPRLEKAEIRKAGKGLEIFVEKCTDNVTSDENIGFLCLSAAEAPGFIKDNNWNAEALLSKDSWSGSRRIPVSEGDYFLFARDELGNLCEKNVQVSGGDTEPPEITGAPVLTGECGGNGYFRAVLINIKASDKDSGLNDYPFSFNDGKTWQESGSLRIVENQSVFIRLRDRAGNVSPAIKTDINNIDSEPPTIKVTEGKRDLNENAAVLKVSASDSLSGIAVMSYIRKDNGAEVTIERIGEGQDKDREKTVLLREDGDYVFIARDFAGNTSEKSITVQTAASADTSSSRSPRSTNDGGASLSGAEGLSAGASSKGSEGLSGGASGKESGGLSGGASGKGSGGLSGGASGKGSGGLSGGAYFGRDEDISGGNSPKGDGLSGGASLKGYDSLSGGVSLNGFEGHSGGSSISSGNRYDHINIDPGVSAKNSASERSAHSDTVFSTKLPAESKKKVKTSSSGGSSSFSSGSAGTVAGGYSPLISSPDDGGTVIKSSRGSSKISSAGSIEGSGSKAYEDDPFVVSGNTTVSRDSPYLIPEDPMSPDDITITDAPPVSGVPENTHLYAKEESIPESLIETAGDNINKNRRKGIILMSVIIFVFLVSLTLFLLIKKGIIVLPEDETEAPESEEGYLKELIKKFDSLFPKASKSG